MKNTSLTALVILVLGNLCHFGLPWWCLAPIAAITGWFFAENGWKAFLGGFSAGLLLWSLTAWYTDIVNAGMLSAKVGQLFMGVQGAQLIQATGFLGGLLAGFGALTGKMAKDALVKPSQKRNYLQERRR